MTERIDIALPAGAVQGSCDARFRGVLDAFVANFRQRGEVGASVAVTLDGKTVVDLWGGLADPATGRPWRQDTISVVWSATKGATALTAHVAAARGLIDLDERAARYWPEFAAGGKGEVTVAQLLSHQAGVAALRDKLPDGAIWDWDEMTRRLAAEAPHWPPGTRNGYHGLTFGWVVGEPLRQVTGKSIGPLFRELVAEPLGLDFWIGLPEEHEPRVAPMIPFIPDPKARQTPFQSAILKDRSSLSSLFILNSGGWWPNGFNTRAGHAAEIGAGNGITNARGLAQMYRPLAQGGGELVPRDAVTRMAATASATGEDAVLLLPTRFTEGFMQRMDNRAWRRQRSFAEDEDSVLIPPDAFGHVGAGGSIGFAAPASSLSFGYSMNRMGPGLLLNPRGQSLVDAAIAAL